MTVSTVGLELPKLPDNRLEEYGEEYRSLCGASDVLILGRTIVTFEAFVAAKHIKEQMKLVQLRSRLLRRAGQ